MSALCAELISKNLLPDAPAFLTEGVQYEVVMGSMAYGVSEDDSDMDVYGFVIPPKAEVFPHLQGNIPLFDPTPVLFEQYQKHHIWDQSALGGRGREYDITLYAISKYFRLLLENNPNIIDSLFVPEHCILFATPMALRIRSQRHLFLHKGCWAKFKGYAYGQIHKIRTKQPIGSRKALLEEFGYDVKFAYHVVRLLNEAEQLLTEGQLQLDRDKEQLKSIRRGEWSLPELEAYFKDKEQALERYYLHSDLPNTPNINAIRELLLDCLEQHFGTLDPAIPRDRSQLALQQIQAILAQYSEN